MKFPLVLSCGHTTRKSISDPAECGCNSIKHYKSDCESPIDRALSQFKGKWRMTLESYGAKLPSGKKHGSCPVCGGKDRFRFDDKDGLGTWFCSQCEPNAGGGLKLLSMYLGKSTIETAKELVSDDSFKTVAPMRIFSVSYDEARAQNIEKAKIAASFMMSYAKKASHSYMENKGLEGEWLVNCEPMMGKDGVIKSGEILFVPVYKNNELVNVQKISISGEKRPLIGGDMQSVYHVIEGSEKSIAVVEGFATGVTINLATKWKTYVSFNTSNLESAVKKAKEDHPDSIVIIFGDHDSIDEKHNRRPGEYYANKAAAPYCAGVVIPDDDDSFVGDWDDYRQIHGIEKLKETLRGMVKSEMQKIRPKISFSAQIIDKTVKNEVVSPVFESIENAPAFGSWINSQVQPSSLALSPSPQKSIKDLPEGVCIDGIDIDSPPGIAGDIVQYMKEGAHRELEMGAFTAMAIQCLAMAGAGISGFMGAKTSMITIILGLSASGKEWPQKVIKEILASSGIKIYGDIRSDKDIIRSAVYDNGKCFYVKDEAHSLLASTSKQEKHSANIPATLMELATTSIMPISRLHLDEFQGQMLNRINRLEKQLTSKEDIRLGYNPDLERPKIEKIDLEIEKITIEINKLQCMIDNLESGIKDPCLNLIALSTPKKLASIIDEDAVESGFLGRGFIFDCGSERIHRNFDLWGRSEEQNRQSEVKMNILKARVGAIAQMASDTSQKRIDAEFSGKEYKMVACDEAYNLMFDISKHYDQYHYINHPRLGAIYARLPERVISVASILAMDNLKNGSLVIEAEYVLYALKLALTSVEHLLSNLKVNEAVEGRTVEDKLEGIKEAIIKRLSVSKKDSRDGWRYKSELKNYLKRQKYYQEISKELSAHGQDAMENAIFSLLGEGKITISHENDKLIKKI